MKYCKLLLICSMLLGWSSTVYSQSNPRQDVLQRAHNKTIDTEELQATDTGRFKFSIYTVDEKAMVGKTHHWFFKLSDSEGEPLNYARVELTGYLKSDPTVAFNYHGSLISLCSEGRYIIGFVKVQQSGPWVLEAVVNNFGTQDTFTYEIEINNAEEDLSTMQH